jgi:hypothetical protein
MMQIFEIKNYQQHNSWLMVFNAVCAFGVLLLARYCILTPAHAQALRGLLARTGNASVASWSLNAVLAAIFGWFSTNVLRLHDRVHEPHLVKWRAGYDTDFILRSLSYDLTAHVSPDLFERAYHDGRIRYKMMQRLFYNFVGDDHPPYTGLRRRFYTQIFNYWVFATLEVYCLAALVLFSAYRIWVGTDPFAWAVLTTAVLYVISRVAGNRVIDAVCPITTEQISVIQGEQSEELESNLIALADELNAARHGGVDDRDNA